MARRRILIAAVVVAVAAAGAVIAVGVTASSNPSTYLALGDSVAFGFRPSAAIPPPDYYLPATFVGYPQYVAAATHTKLVNASCPGETVASMISVTGLSNGCENLDGHGGGYRTQYPLHVAYTGSQLAFALHYLDGHHHVTLVTIDLGANDVTVCEAITSDHCTGAGEIAELRNEVTTGLTTVLHDLRATGYRGRLVVLTYYATTPAELPVATALDAVLTAVAGHAGAEVADGLTAFSSAHGDACRAGLLIALPAGGCDIHPTLRGQQLLAAAVEAAAHA